MNRLSNPAEYRVRRPGGAVVATSGALLLSSLVGGASPAAAETCHPVGPGLLTITQETGKVVLSAKVAPCEPVTIVEAEYSFTTSAKYPQTKREVTAQVIDRAGTYELSSDAVCGQKDDMWYTASNPINVRDPEALTDGHGLPYTINADSDLFTEDFVGVLADTKSDPSYASFTIDEASLCLGVLPPGEAVLLPPRAISAEPNFTG